MSKKITFSVITRNEAIWDILQDTKLKSNGPIGIYMAFVERNIIDHFHFLFEHSQPKVIKDAYFVLLHAYAHGWSHLIHRANSLEYSPENKVDTPVIEGLGLAALRECLMTLLVLCGEIRKRYSHEIYEEYLYAIIKPLGFTALRQLVECGPLKDRNDVRKRVINWLLFKEGERKSFL